MKRDFPRRAIHLDFHTMPGVYDVGRDFDADKFADTLSRAGVEYITAFARCNLGFAYYPTQIGIPHPGLQTRDLLGPMVKACHKRKIAVAAYFNAGLDHEHALLHRDWTKVNSEGQVCEMRHKGHFFRKMCLNTGYADYLLGMVKEVLEKYPVDGIFLDCFNISPCYGVECLDGMQRAGMSLTDPADARRYCWEITYAFARRATVLVRSLRKDAYVYFNGLSHTSQPTHLELEVLPNGGWGYDALPAQVRYARTLKKPMLVMTGRFHSDWCDIGGLRTEHSLLFDCCNAIANGAGYSVGDYMHPRGKLQSAVYDVISQVNCRLQKLDEWTCNVRSRADIAVVFPSFKWMPGEPENALPEEWHALQGATRMLIELKLQFDVCDGEGDLSKYKVLILPDYLTMTPGLRRKLINHVKRGGAVVGGAFAGLDEKGGKFDLPGYPAVYMGKEEYDPTYFEVLPGMKKDIPDMPTAVYKPGIVMRAARSARVLARLWKPYFNHAEWDGRHEHLYTPPEKKLARPALVGKGNLFHFAFPVFECYRSHAMPVYKYLVRNCLKLALPKPMVKVDGMPSFGQVTVTEQGQRQIAHLLTYVPELRGSSIQIIEEPVLVRDVELALRCDRPDQFKMVYLAPDRRPLQWKEKNGYVHVRIPEVNGYQMVVFE
ncbi:MAG: beta-galactosidase trimerization domain-containing protein [Lentisphaerae bacterium]|nr:beta-galactosidase trimerization domain-containing protein [Lentisphaerota bacterium]